MTVSLTHIWPTPDGGTHPGVLFYMDAFGLRPQLNQMAERLASHGYVVLVPNVFYRHGRAPLVADPPDLLRPENHPKMIEALAPFLRSMDPLDAMRDAGAYLDFLAAQASVADGPVGVTGYCMGGALALRTAGSFPERVAAAAIFHGGNLATDAEDSPHLLADRIRGELYFGHADQDRSMPEEQIHRLDAALDVAGSHYRSEVYAGAMHGFTMADTAAYDEVAAERHWTELLGLLDRVLSPAI
jgi:carboxymethylenebutenolidase